MSVCLGKIANGFYLASTLYDAIEDRDYRSVSYMLKEKRANPNIILHNGISPLHLALGSDDPNFALEIIKLMLQHGGNPNIATDDGLTPLHISAAWGNLELAQLLVCSGADPEIRDFCNALPIHYAVEHKHMDLARYLHFVVNSGSTFLDLQDEYGFHLTLDKIIVNNGIAEAEYQVEEPPKSSFDLQQLPKISSTELVENWCCKEGDTDTSDASLKHPLDTRFVNCNPRVYNKRTNVSESLSLEFDCSSKFKSKQSFKLAEASVESGIAVLTDSDSCVIQSSNDNLIKRSQDTSSDYCTCNEISGSTNILEKNIIDEILPSFDKTNVFVDNNTIDTNECTDENISDFKLKPTDDFSDNSLNVIEIYRYTDEHKGITLFENRLLVNQKSNEDDSHQSESSKLTSLPPSFEYDTDCLRRELNQRGFPTGPITKTTKRVYLRRLFRIKKKAGDCLKPQHVGVKSKVYSKELEKTLNDSNWLHDISLYKNLEETVSKEFTSPDHSKRWREGINKSSFTYLLLDPRVTNNLPFRRDSLTLEETWRTFLSAIFYVGKGKRSRPYAHLYEAVSCWDKTGDVANVSKKLKHIIDIWKDDAGVVCLHIFQNVIPCEAYTREAAMIKALKLENIDNKRVGDFYGLACSWPSQQQKMLGVLLLHKAMLIFLNEGERQLKPADIN